MAIDFNSIKESSNEDLINLAKKLDTKLNEIKDAKFYITWGYPLRAHLPSDISFTVTANYEGGSYETEMFRLVVREVVKLHPSYVASKLKTEYKGNVLLVNQWEPQIEAGLVEKYFKKENVRVVWWSVLINSF